MIKSDHFACDYTFDKYATDLWYFVMYWRSNRHNLIAIAIGMPWWWRFLRRARRYSTAINNTVFNIPEGSLINDSGRLAAGKYLQIAKIHRLPHRRQSIMSKIMTAVFNRHYKYHLYCYVTLNSQKCSPWMPSIALGRHHQQMNVDLFHRPAQSYSCGRSRDNKASSFSWLTHAHQRVLNYIEMPASIVFHDVLTAWHDTMHRGMTFADKSLWSREVALIIDRHHQYSWCRRLSCRKFLLIRNPCHQAYIAIFIGAGNSPMWGENALFRLFIAQFQPLLPAHSRSASPTASHGDSITKWSHGMRCQSAW